MTAIQNEAIEALEAQGLDPDTAMIVIKMIAAGQVPHIKIEY